MIKKIRPKPTTTSNWTDTWYELGNSINHDDRICIRISRGAFAGTVFTTLESVLKVNDQAIEPAENTMSVTCELELVIYDGVQISILSKEQNVVLKEEIKNIIQDMVIWSKNK